MANDMQQALDLCAVFSRIEKNSNRAGQTRSREAATKASGKAAGTQQQHSKRKCHGQVDHQKCSSHQAILLAKTMCA